MRESHLAERGQWHEADFGARLRKLRIARGLRQRDLAYGTGHTSAYIAALESGRRKTVPPEIRSRLAAVLGVPESQLLEGGIPGMGEDLEVALGKALAARDAGDVDEAVRSLDVIKLKVAIELGRCAEVTGYRERALRHYEDAERLLAWGDDTDRAHVAAGLERLRG